MKTQRMIVLGIALLGVLLAGSTAFAQGPGGPPRGGPPREGPPFGGNPANHVAGKVSAISSSSITVKGRDNAEQTITVTSSTRFVRMGEPATLTDFKVDDFVAAVGERNADGQFVAERVMGGDRLPQMRGGPRGGPGRLNGIGGEFVSADAAAGTITVRTRDGAEKTIYTNGETRIARNRQPATLADFRAGDHVASSGTPDSEGRYVADRVFGGDQPPPPGPPRREP